MLFDDKFKMVEENSGVKQVKAEPDQLQTLSQDKMVMKKSGFLYVYTSNESPQEVLFDNLVVAHSGGPVLEETHYYPFGLTMAGISSNALVGSRYLENRMKYNGKELQNKEFSDGSGLDWYDYGARMYDMQIGRWNVIDPLLEVNRKWAPYVYGYDNPIKFIDPDGMANANALEREAVTQWIQEIKDMGVNYNGYIGDAKGPKDWVHDKTTGRVYWDSRVHSSNDLKDENLEYWGASGKTYHSKNGNVLLQANGKWAYSDALDEGTLGKNFFLLSYPGPNNPKSYDGTDNFSYAPFFESEYPAIEYDRRYDNLKIAGGAGLFTDTRALGADMKFVAEEFRIVFSVNGPNYGVLDQTNRGTALG